MSVDYCQALDDAAARRVRTMHEAGHTDDETWAWLVELAKRAEGLGTTELEQLAPDHEWRVGEVALSSHPPQPSKGESHHDHPANPHQHAVVHRRHHP